MKKGERRRAKDRKHLRVKKLRRNKISSSVGADLKHDLMFADIFDIAGNALISASLAGASFQEKTVIASLIPIVLNMMRKGLQVSIEAGNVVESTSTADSSAAQPEKAN